MTQEQTDAYAKGFKDGWDKAEERVDRLIDKCVHNQIKEWEKVVSLSYEEKQSMKSCVIEFERELKQKIKGEKE